MRMRWPRTSGCGFLGASGPRLRAKSALRSSDQRGPGRRLSPKRPLGRKDHRARGRTARVGTGGDAPRRRHRTIRARRGLCPRARRAVQATRRRGRRRALLERAQRLGCAGGIGTERRLLGADRRRNRRRIWMKVARYNYAHQLGADIEPLIADLRTMLVGGRYELTAEVKQFEAELARFLGARHVRGVNTGTDALVVALRALGIGRGDEVITQANTFHATVGAIELVGAEPVLVDVDPGSFLIDKRQLRDAIGPKTRALMPVHLYGKPTPMAEIMALAESRRLFVIEDAAQARRTPITSSRFERASGTRCSPTCASARSTRSSAIRRPSTSSRRSPPGAGSKGSSPSPRHWRKSCSACPSGRTSGSTRSIT